MKLSLFYFLIITLLSLNVFAQEKKDIVLIIDPGHGGRDPGNLATSKKFENEKHINLKIANKLGNYIESLLDGVTVIYTRKTDIYISPQERAEFSNKKNADYFISIHCNYHSDSKIKGSEVHIHKTIFNTSYKLAKRIDKDFKKRAKRYSRGIKNYNDRNMHILVLRDTRMPAVLVECGFMSNPHEEKFLNSDEGQSIMASAIYRAFRDFSGAKIKPKLKPKINPVPVKPVQKKCPKFYKVQIMASVKPVSLTSTQFKKLEVPVKQEIGSKDKKFRYKYFVGEVCTLKEANVIKENVRKKGFPDAFVIVPK